MAGLPKLPKEIRTQVGVGAFLIVIGFIWFLSLVYLVKPDQILPTGEQVRDAYEGFVEIGSVPASSWTLDTVGLLIGKLFVLVFLDILFVVARYGGITLFFLGGFAVFDAISNLRKAGR